MDAADPRYSVVRKQNKTKQNKTKPGMGWDGNTTCLWCGREKYRAWLRFASHRFSRRARGNQTIGLKVQIQKTLARGNGWSIPIRQMLVERTSRAPCRANDGANLFFTFHAACRHRVALRKHEQKHMHGTISMCCVLCGSCCVLLINLE